MLLYYLVAEVDFVQKGKDLVPLLFPRTLTLSSPAHVCIYSFNLSLSLFS